MIALGAMLRLTIKAVLWLVAATVLTIALWFVANRLFDEAADPKRIVFAEMPSDQIPDVQNISIGILGLNAPSGEDPTDYGAKIRALDASGNWGAVREMLQGPKSLQPTVKSEEITCWLYSDPLPEKGCLPLDQVATVLQKNKELLNRHKGLYRLDRYVNAGGTTNSGIISIDKLSIAEMREDLRQSRQEAAYGKWREQFLLVRKILRGVDPLFGKAVSLVEIGFTLPVLDDILLADPDIGKEHSAELLEMLRADGFEIYNPEGIARAELALVSNMLQSPNTPDVYWKQDLLYWSAYHLGQRNRMLNRYSAFLSEYAAALRLPWPQVNAELDRLRDRRAYFSAWDSLVDPVGTIFVKQLVEDRVRNRTMIEQMQIYIGLLRLNALRVRIINENIGDAAIPGFLASVDASLYDPITETPMKWREKDRKIYGTDPRGAFPSLWPYVVLPTSGASGASDKKRR